MKKAILAAFVGVCALAILPLPALPAPKGKVAGTIMKCQDASGRWHYGDSAAASCAQSKITVIDQQGIKRGVVDAPPTAAELKEREAKKAEEERAKEQAKRDEVLLKTYSHEADILYIRDRKVAELQASIKASADTLVPLRATLKRLETQAETEQKSGGSVSEQTTKALEQTKSQIAKHEASIAQRRQEQAAIKTQAEQDLARYRELKGETQSATTGSATR
jgi:hypothetical protein